MNRRVSTLIPLLLFLTGCGEQASPVLTPAQRPAPSKGSGDGNEITVAVRKNGKVERFRGHVNTRTRTISLTSVHQPCALDDQDPACEVPSSPCSYADPSCALVSWDIAGTDSVYIEDTPTSEMAGVSVSGPYICPAYVDEPHFNHAGHHFQIDGRAQLATLLPATSGIPKGRYLLPPGPWLSDDGKMRIWSGYIDGTCFVTESWWGPLRIQTGTMGWYRFSGTAESVASSSSSGDGVWVSYGGPGGGSYLDAEAAKVLLKFIDSGQCTTGWVIEVDGVRVC